MNNFLNNIRLVQTKDLLSLFAYIHLNKKQNDHKQQYHYQINHNNYIQLQFQEYKVQQALEYHPMGLKYNLTNIPGNKYLHCIFNVSNNLEEAFRILYVIQIIINFMKCKKCINSSYQHRKIHNQNLVPDNYKQKLYFVIHVQTKNKVPKNLLYFLKLIKMFGFFYITDKSSLIGYQQNSYIKNYQNRSYNQLLLYQNFKHHSFLKNQLFHICWLDFYLVQRNYHLQDIHH